MEIHNTYKQEKQGRPDLPADQKLLKRFEHLTLLHLMMMVYSDISKLGTAKNKFPSILIEEISSKLKHSESDAHNEIDNDEEFENHKVTAVLRRRPDRHLNKNTYKEIYRILKTNPCEAPYYYLNKQCDKIKSYRSKDDPEEYALKLWLEMGKLREWYDSSYLQVFNEMSPWLFQDHSDVLEVFDAERTYKLLTVAIAISLNLETSTTKVTNDPLDELCKEFLYAAPPEELPDFTLREVFDVLFSDDGVFAVKQAGDAEYSVVKRENLTEKDRLYILLPGFGEQYDLHPDSEKAATALLDNKIDNKEIADRVLAFYRIFSNNKDSVWEKLVAHLKAGLPECVRAKAVMVFTTDAHKIRAALRAPLLGAEVPQYSGPYLERLCNNEKWSGITYNEFWNGAQVDISLPEQCESEKDAEQLYQYIAACVLIALCCLKVEGSKKAEKRQAFKEALIHKIHAPMSVPIEVHEEAIRRIKALEYVVQDVTKENEDQKRHSETVQMTLRDLVRQWMIEFRTSFDANHREALKRYINELLPLCGYTLNEMAEIREELIAISRVRKNDSSG